MPRISTPSISRILRRFTSRLLVPLLAGSSIPITTRAARTSVTAANTTFTTSSRLLTGAGLSLFQLQTKAALATKSALSAVLSPSEFDKLKANFEEPLVPIGPTTSKEDAALFQALRSYNVRSAPDDFSALTNFLKSHPTSVWRIPLLINLGLTQYHYGYPSQALTTWEEGWEEGRTLQSPQAKRLVARVVGELARMHARLGHADRLETLFKEIGNRPIAGQATEAITGAKEGLWVMRNQPGEAYLCGPFGLKNLLAAMNRLTPENLNVLHEFQSGTHGVTLAQLDNLADRVHLPHRVVYRSAGEPVPVPSVVHWKVNHFAAIVAEENGRFHISDPTFGGDLWVTKAALDAEATGYFLVPSDVKSSDWRIADARESGQIWGMGVTNTNDQDSTLLDGDILCISCLVNQVENTIQNVLDATTPPSDRNRFMAGYNMHEMVVSLHITDTPVGYAPPVGPGVYTTLVYNQREANQPTNFTFFNLGQKWTTNWSAYIVDDPRSPGSSVTRAAAGGGTVQYAGYVSSTGAFTPETRTAATLVRLSSSQITYQRQMADGGMEVYSQSDGATSYPRRLFLTKIVDSAGNALTLNYDSSFRLTSITDATGRNTTFFYGVPGKSLLLTQITDPFGRSAQLSYDSSGRLIQITDTLGIKSQFTYDNLSLVNAMTTPYGTTNFSYGSNGNQRYLQVTDPLGHTERLEFNQTVSSLPYSDPANTVPVGLPSPFNAYLYGRNSFYWNKHVFALYGADYTKARNRHWTHESSNTTVTNHTVESIKNPLENRIWMYYPGESSTGFSGTYDRPSVFGRVLDDGSTQIYQRTFNSLGHEKDVIDPLGRETQIMYAGNDIDPITIQQRTSASGFSTVAQFTWNGQHRPLSYTDAAGQKTNFTYNAAGQVTQVTDALGETTKFSYDSLGYLLLVTNANGKTQTSYTRDLLGRVATVTDSEGYSVQYSYDAGDRVITETFPDTTTRTYSYMGLDLASVTDRQGNTTQYGYDAMRNLVQVNDPLGHKTNFGYHENQILKTLTDPNGNTTAWNIDIENRPTAKQYADGTQVATAYENTTSRVKTITDALGQLKTLTYGKDDSLVGIAYTKTVNPTPNVAFAYDPYFSRLTSMTDGTGKTTYAYVGVGSVGALNLQKETTPFTNGTIAYTYDVLGRVASRTVDTSTETFSYDALSRLTAHGTALGAFSLGYLGQTRQLTKQQLNTGIVGTSWIYDSNTNDRRLQTINNSGPGRSFNLTTTPENLITTIQESASNGSAWAPKTWNYAYDSSYRLTEATAVGSSYGYGLDATGNITGYQAPAGTVSANYNGLNEIVNLGGQSYIYDKNGNVLDDGQRVYTWDAENRLLSVVSKSSAQGSIFKYDGVGRRVAIDNGLNTSVETRYLWCGDVLCQSRSSSDAVVRRYYPEGEFLVSTGATLFYEQDQLGSVRDVLSAQNGTRIASFDYDPYGNPAQSSARVNPDFRFARLFYDQQDGLYLATYRVYDSKRAGWLSRDPRGETRDRSLYSYAMRSPVTAADSLGLQAIGQTSGAQQVSNDDPAASDVAAIQNGSECANEATNAFYQFAVRLFGFVSPGDASVAGFNGTLGGVKEGVTGILEGSGGIAKLFGGAKGAADLASTAIPSNGQVPLQDLIQSGRRLQRATSNSNCTCKHQ